MISFWGKGFTRDLKKALSHGTPAERKRVAREWADKVKRAPEGFAVEISCRLPEAFVEWGGNGERPSCRGMELTDPGK
jgi:hypothetical protein